MPRAIDGQGAGLATTGPRGAGEEESERPELITTFSRGLAVIRAFSTSNSSMSIAEVAKAVGLNRATARRFLRTLEAEGYVAAENGRYSLQPRVLELGFAYLASVSVDEMLQRYLFQAAEKVQESCVAALLDGPHVVIIARAQTTYPRVMKLALTTGTRVPAHLTAAGRILLANLPPPALDTYLAETEFEQQTVNTVADPEALRGELEKIRQRGYCILDQEIEAGVRACAILVPRPHRPPMAISISSHATRGSVESVRRDHLPVLQETGESLMTLLSVGA